MNPSDPFDNAVQLGRLLQDGVAKVQAENLAKVVRTFHDAYVEAGFTDEQAFTFVHTMMKSNTGVSS